MERHLSSRTGPPLLVALLVTALLVVVPAPSPAGAGPSGFTDVGPEHRWFQVVSATARSFVRLECASRGSREGVR